jgi:hypothetical protein
MVFVPAALACTNARTRRCLARTNVGPLAEGASHELAVSAICSPVRFERELGLRQRRLNYTNSSYHVI